MVSFVAALFMFGAFAYLATLVPGPLSREINVRLRSARWLATAAIVLATAALLPVTVASIGDGWADAFSWEIMHDVLLDTDIGTAWLLRAVTVALLGVAAATTHSPAWT